MLGKLSAPTAMKNSLRKTSEVSSFRYLPLQLRDGTQITISTPQDWGALGQYVSHFLNTFHQNLTQQFGVLPPFETAVRIMDDHSFFRLTGAPAWTNALYLRGEIIVPLSPGSRLDWPALQRTLSHEYTHAVIHALSNGQCPGWLDEGLAQWAEGSPSVALRPALAKWLEHREPVPLSLLRGGFTRLSSDMVPAAYAQSLFAANTLMNTFEVSMLRSYMDQLRAGSNAQEAFLNVFGIREENFEKQLQGGLRRWAAYHAHTASAKPATVQYVNTARPH